MDAPAQKAGPKRYIRTFSGDMDAVQKGGTPDLAPLGIASAKDKLVEGSPMPPPALAPAAAPAPSEPKRPEPLVSPIETYAADFSDKVKQENASPVTVLAAQQDARRAVVTPPQPASTLASKIYVAAGIFLLVAGLAGAGFAYVRYQAALAPVVLAPSVSAPIFVDERQQISGTGEKLAQAIEESAAKPLAQNAIRFLYLPPATTTADIFSQLDLSAPNVLVRNIRPEGSMAGIINAGGERTPFFILSVETYGSTLSGMLAWESVMPSALAPFYPAYPAPVALAPSPVIATTSLAASPARPLFAAGFKDEVLSNHDVRVYRDVGGRSVFMYGYWNQSTLVIARTPTAFAEIINRLANSR